MTDYSRSTNFTAKDALSSGDPNKVIKGAEIDAEFNNIQTANNSKLDASRFPNVSGNVTASHTELNILDGATVSTAELNILDGATVSTAELNILDGATVSTAELNTLDGATVSTAELNILDGATISTAELNTLDGFTGSTTDLNSISGHNSALDTLLNNFSEDRVELGGDFDAGQEVVCSRIGNIVTITSDGPLSHSNGFTASSSFGAIPAAYRPSNNAGTISCVYFNDSAKMLLVEVNSSGTLETTYTYYAGGTVNIGYTVVTFTISYVIASNIT